MGNQQGDKMSRSGIESSLDRLIVALCADYERRARLIREGGIPLRMLSELSYLNMKILEGAEEEACYDGMIFISEIGARVGSYSTSHHILLFESFPPQWLPPVPQGIPAGLACV